MSSTGTRVRVVELFSAPGAGKTTLVDAISSERPILDRSSLSSSWRETLPVSKVARVARAILDPRIGGTALAAAVTQRFSSRESYARLAKLVARSRWLASRRGTFILDQGMLQELWSIHFASTRFDPNPKVLSRLVKQLYKGLDAQIVFIDIDHELAAKRIAGRMHGDSRLDGLPQTAVSAALARGERLPGAILEAAKEAGLSVNVLDGSAPREDLIGQLGALLPADGSEAVGNNGRQKKTVVDMQQAALLARELGATIAGTNEPFEVVVGIANGGVHPAFHVAEELGLPLRILRIERNATRLKKPLRFARKALSSPALRGPVRKLNRFVDRKVSGVRANTSALTGLNGKRILLVDDCIDSGASVALARTLLEKEGATAIKTAVLCWTTKYDSNQQHGVTPDFYLGRRLPSYPWSADNPDYSEFRSWLSKQG